MSDRAARATRCQLAREGLARVSGRISAGWRRTTRQYTLLPAALATLAALVTLTLLTTALVPEQRTSLWVSLVGTFWGFGLAQVGAIAYERARQRDELASMFVSARYELQMNRGIVVWIKHLIDKDLAEREVHGMGFAGLDEFSVRAVEYLVSSPLTYRFTSDEFSSKELLSVYQTLLVYRREIPTDKVDGRDKTRYGQIRLSAVIESFDVLNGLLDAEARRVFGAARWQERIGRAIEARERVQAAVPTTGDVGRDAEKAR